MRDGDRDKIRCHVCTVLLNQTGQRINSPKAAGESKLTAQLAIV